MTRWIALILFAACTPAPAPVHPDADPDACPAACARWAVWCRETSGACGCEESEVSPGLDLQPGTEDDESCTEVCEGIERQGTISLHPECVVKAESCEAARGCSDGS